MDRPVGKHEVDPARMQTGGVVPGGALSVGIIRRLIIVVVPNVQSLGWIGRVPGTDGIDPNRNPSRVSPARSDAVVERQGLLPHQESVAGAVRYVGDAGRAVFAEDVAGAEAGDGPIVEVADARGIGDKIVVGLGRLDSDRGQVRTVVRGGSDGW